MVLVLAAVPAQATTQAATATVAPQGFDATARSEVAALRRATAVNDRDGNKLFDDLDARYALNSGRQDVIVSFVSDLSGARGAALVADTVPTAQISQTFEIVPALAGRLTAAEAARAAALPGVRQIELDSPGDKELESATAVMGADAVVDEMGISGSLDADPGAVTAEDVTIAILDTGFDRAHVDLKNKIEKFVDIADGQTAAYDSDGHGTHVASIAAGWGHGQAKYRGVAPGAGIVGLRIENESHALAGFQWIVKNRAAYDIKVATISFGFGLATDGTTALERAVDAAWNAGVVCFKSTGNSGPNPSTITVPAAARGILAIGSLLDPGGAPTYDPALGTVQTGTKYGFVLSEFSSRGPTSDGRIKPDLLAPAKGSWRPPGTPATGTSACQAPAWPHRSPPAPPR
jgi:serine protease AprX